MYDELVRNLLDVISYYIGNSCKCNMQIDLQLSKLLQQKEKQT